jgi:acetate kinase
MTSTSRPILTVNGGSSSIKFALFDPGASPRRITGGSLERIGLPGSTLEMKSPNEANPVSRSVKAANPLEAVGILMDWLVNESGYKFLAAVGHRIVQGGAKYCEPRQIDEEMLKEFSRLSPFDPEHLPEELRLAEAFRERFPDLPQVACFDTAFHHALPRVAQIVPIPRRYEAKGVRRYGFHGLSYTYLMEALAQIGGPEEARSRVILAHLGSGASMAAVREGHSLDTTMGFTPASGLVMGTRTGDLDPGLIRFLARSEGMSADQFDTLVNSKSGLLGVSETSSDVRDLLLRQKTDIRAAEAIELFCYQAKKWIGALAAALGGVDTLVFAGGIGEQSPEIRRRICTGLEFLGITVDEAQNSENADLISNGHQRVKIRVIRTDEELVIAQSVTRVLKLNAIAS